MSRDEKVMTLLWRNALSTFITELLLLPKFDNSSPSVTRDKEIFHVIMTLLLPEAEHPIEPFQ